MNLLHRKDLKAPAVQLRNWKIHRPTLATMHMYDNMTISPAHGPVKLCFFADVVVGNNSFPFYAMTLSTSVIIAILSPVAVTGNILIMATIWRNQTLRTPSYILLSALAFTDFCKGLITQPFYVTSLLICLELLQEINSHLSFLPYAMTIAAGCGLYFNLLTLLLITLMSIERWLHMSRRSLLTVRLSCIIVAVILVILIPVVVFRLLNFLKKTHEIVSRTVFFVIILFCIVTTSFAYFKVFRIIRIHQQQVTANEPSQNFGQPAINMAKYKKSVFSILYILVLLFVSYLPMLVFVGLSLSSSYNRSDLELVFKMSIMFLFLSSSLNPLIYLWRMNDIRNGVKQLLKHLLCKDS